MNTLLIAFIVLYTTLVLGIGALLGALWIAGRMREPEPEHLSRHEKRELKKLAPIDNKYR